MLSKSWLYLNLTSILAGDAAAGPVVFTAGGERYPLTPQLLDVRTDWGAAVAKAARTGGGSLLARGFRRLGLRLFPQDIHPAPTAYAAGVAYELSKLSSAVDADRRDARLVRHGLRFAVVAGSPGRTLDTQAAALTIVVVP